MAAPPERGRSPGRGRARERDRPLCYPLTLTDRRSRFLLGCDAMAAISDEEARECCEEIFRRYGVPKAMRSDNGVPFASDGLGQPDPALRLLASIGH